MTLAISSYKGYNASVFSNTRGGFTDSNANKSLPVPVSAPAPSSNEKSATRIVDETRQTLDDGRFRRTQTFETADGRGFTRTEDILLTARGSERTVIQQNPSGSITRYEEILDRQQDGTFRRTQRFTDESGQTTAQITPSVTVTDPFILTGGQGTSPYTPSAAFAPLRGTQLDLTA